ncbi:hypothetical protein BCR36DRAFT_403137 [Piromyces finnis]|uniref:Uncharacterized protein n=1 Tax=Piromyces finnis TaxID=1754191 RepID=A0A1Y1VFU2_9FUNG|nr:hypothetical protein BCR36DRAFT_403137 [Piromyces finnis]|eukprot:ORX54709.1 hypothetical protein BCR36DRAFT_403137 [Piromyces finnis]
MSASVKIFNPIPIIAKPFIGTLNQRDNKKSDSKNNKCSFIVSATPENSNNIKYSVLTVQGQGIYLNNIIDQNNIYSWSVSPNIRFTCPAIYVNDNNENEKVIAVIEDDLEISESEKKKTLWIWDLLKKDEDGMINKIVKKVKKPISFLKPISFENDNGNNYILSFNTDSSLTLYTPDFKIVHNHKGSGGICCFKKIINTTESIINIIAIYRKNNEMIVRISSINKSTNISINLKNELSFPLLKDTEVLTYEYNGKTNSVYALLSTGSIMRYSLDIDDKKGESIANVKSVYSQFNSENSLTVESEEGQIFNEKFSMTFLNDDLIALIGKGGNNDTDLLSVWDLKYGTLQFKKIFSNEKWEEITSSTFEIGNNVKQGHNKYYKIFSITSDDLGDIILLTTTEITENNPISFKSNIYMFPFHCKTINLLMALGKKNTGFNVDAKLGLPTIFTPEINQKWNLNSWLEESNKKVKSDQEEFEKLMKSESSKFEANYNKYILKHKVVDDEKQDKKNNNVNNEKSLLDVSQAVVNSLLEKCFSDKSKNWPKNVVASLLINNMVSSYLMNKKFISSLLEKDELQLLEIALSKVRDINENDLVLIIRYICGDAGNPEWQWKPAKTRLANLKKFHKKDNYYVAQELIDEESGEITAFDFISTSGTQYLLEKVLMYPRNVPIFKNYLKQLNSNQLEAILPYLIHLLMDSVSKEEKDIDMIKKDEKEKTEEETENLEVNDEVFIEKITWLFKDKTPCSMAGIKVDAVVETISNIVDVNLTNTLLSEKLQKQLKTLRKHLGRTTHKYNQIQSSLSGPLTMFAEKAKYFRSKSMESSKSKGKHNTKKHYKNKILSQWNEAVEYTAEVLQF